MVPGVQVVGLQGPTGLRGRPSVYLGRGQGVGYKVQEGQGIGLLGLWGSIGGHSESQWVQR